MIQELIDGAKDGDTVTIPAGTYDVDTIAGPIWIKQRARLTILLTGAVIRAIPNDVNDRVYFPIGITESEEITLIDGTIRGERDKHTGTNESGFGHGIAIGGGSKKIKLQTLGVTACEGDGIIIVDGYAVELDRVGSYRNRRNGLTASQVDGLWIHDSGFYNTGGAAPQAGIDFEPDLPTQYVRNAKIERSKFSGNAGADILIACPPAQREHIDILPDNVFSGRPIDGTDGIVPWWAKIIGPYTNWLGYPRELHI